ncbi:YER078C-like protein [Saccharomyces cerevisiae x Saccharomyces kudriavzevii VIN7]|uniref:YER078C-like protein n=1 Tax=Saccharomyces cerevisiae x Saccharomyces kudriavzevii (strain VIN7) TaxID=1095631 RepID=H0GTX9_SACCK|nr:YER078C-like protein [Saccharomyces cerevisiae x Saccharomyces kudriavzevii VIN7]
MLQRINVVRLALSPCKRHFSKSTASFGQRKNSVFTNRARIPIEAGQPLHETRPFLIKAGELTPGIPALEYYERRIRLAEILPSKSCVILAGNDIQFASGAVFYPFQQDNDLFYLSGWNEPNSVMILEKPTDDLSDTVFHMLVPPKDAFAEKWEGFRSGVHGAQEIFNADKSAPINDLSKYLPKIINRNDSIYFDTLSTPNSGSSNYRHIKSLLDGSGSSNRSLNSIANKNIKPVSKRIAEFRKIKSPQELRIMRRAGQISGRSFNQAFAKRFRNERTLDSFLHYKFVSGGCDKDAYIPVVATGSNSLCIHYTRNDDVMYDDEMVLVDAAGSLGGYCADISRTWPNNGKFTGAQKELYEAVLNVQRGCIDLCKASNNFSLHDIHEESIRLMKQELKNLGIDKVSGWNVEKLYPHYIGHNLGLDVHDVPKVSRYEPLKPGQVITIEPGLYIPDDESFPSYFRNIGIRIEDDIAVGEDSYTNLTVEAVKEIDDLENVMQNGVSTKFEEDEVTSL